MSTPKPSNQCLTWYSCCISQRLCFWIWCSILSHVYVVHFDVHFSATYLICGSDILSHMFTCTSNVQFKHNYYMSKSVFNPKASIHPVFNLMFNYKAHIRCWIRCSLLMQLPLFNSVSASAQHVSCSMRRPIITYATYQMLNTMSTSTPHILFWIECSNLEHMSVHTNKSISIDLSLPLSIYNILYKGVAIYIYILLLTYIICYI